MRAAMACSNQFHNRWLWGDFRDRFLCGRVMRTATIHPSHPCSAQWHLKSLPCEMPTHQRSPQCCHKVPLPSRSEKKWEKRKGGRRVRKRFVRNPSACLKYRSKSINKLQPYVNWTDVTWAPFMWWTLKIFPSRSLRSISFSFIVSPQNVKQKIKIVSHFKGARWKSEMRIALHLHPWELSTNGDEAESRTKQYTRTQLMNKHNWWIYDRDPDEVEDEEINYNWLHYDRESRETFIMREMVMEK